MTITRTENDMHEALYKVACDFPEIPGTSTKGVKALAQILGMPTQVLRNKLSPDIKTHKISFEEASAIMELCARAGMEDAYAPLRAMNWRHGFVAIDRNEENETDDECIHKGASEVLQEIGAMAGAMSEALADGHVCNNDLQKVESRFRKATAGFAAWFARFRSRANKDSARRGIFRKRVDQSTTRSSVQ